MSALSDFANALKYQSELLEAASVFDESAGFERPVPAVGKRLRWVRQDRNRINYESKLACVDDPLKAIKIKPQGRIDTRTTRILRRIKRQGSSLDLLRVNALIEAEKRATYTILAPLIVEAWQAHVALLEWYEHGLNDWGQVKAKHENAVDALSQYVTPEVETAPPGYAPEKYFRDKFIYESWQAGNSWQTILDKLAEHPEWEHDLSKRSLENAAKKYYETMKIVKQLKPLRIGKSGNEKGVNTRKNKRK